MIRWQPLRDNNSLTFADIMRAFDEKRKGKAPDSGFRSEKSSQKLDWRVSRGS